MEKNTIKLKDNSSYDNSYLKKVGNIVDMISNKSIDQLKKEGFLVLSNLTNETSDLSDDDFILRLNNGRYSTSNIIGFFQTGNQELIIESRFSDKNNYFITYLLDRVLETPNIVTSDFSLSSNENILNILIYIFPYYLKEAVKKGLFKTYVRREYNDANLKGPISINEHIKLNTPFRGNIAYSQRELTKNNYLNKLIRHTVEYIRQKSNTKNILSQVAEEVKQIVEVTWDYKYHDRFKIINENVKIPINHAFYSDYRVLQELCILILKSSQHNIGQGKMKIKGILCDVSWLWEEYVNLLVSEDYHHPKNKEAGVASGAQWLFTDLDSQAKSKYQGLIYPDFISKNTKERTIADAKYKPISNIGNRDYLQLLAYMYRFEAKKGFYIYPESSDNADSKFNLNLGSSYEKDIRVDHGSFIKKVGINIPTCSPDYESFSNQMRAVEKKFKLE